MPGEGKIRKMPFLRVFFNTFDEFLDAYAQYLSKGGMFIKTPVKLQGGEKIKIEMKLKSGQPLLRGIAEVVWEKVEGGKTTGVGVKFIQLTPESLKFVENVVQKKLKEKEEKQSVEKEILQDEKVQEEEIIEEPEVIEEPEEVVEPEEVIAPPEEESKGDFLAPPEEVEEVVEEIPPEVSEKGEKEPEKEVEKSETVEPVDEFAIDEEIAPSQGKKKIVPIILPIILAVVVAAGAGFLFLRKSHKEVPVETAAVSGKNIPSGVVPGENLPEENVEKTPAVTPVTAEVKKEESAQSTAKESSGGKNAAKSLPEAAETRAASRIVDIKVGNRESEVILDGKIEKNRVRIIALKGGVGNYPRVVLKIKIPQRKLDRWVVRGKGKLKRIRLGIHPPEVWLVHDFLTGKHPPRCRIEVKDNRIILRW